MNMHRHFGISTTSLRDSTIRTLMDDLDRTMRLVECDIAAEEERAVVGVVVVAAGAGVVSVPAPDS